MTASRWGQGGAEPEPLVNALLDQVGAIGPVRAFSGLTWNERLAGPLPANLTLLSYGGLGLLRTLSRRGGRPAAGPRSPRSCTAVW